MMMSIDRDQAGLLLQTLGVEADLPLLEHGCALAEESLCGLLHREEIPKGLEQTALRMAVGFYLRTAAGAGKLKAEAVNLSAPALTQLTMGDTSQHWDSSATPQARLEGLITALCTVPDKLIWAYRAVAK